MRVRTIVVVLTCSALATLSTTTATAGAEPSAPPGGEAPATSPACGPVPSGWARCLAVRLADPSLWQGRHTGQRATASTNPPNGYGPSDLASAYNLPTANQGRGQLVAIVDAYDDPTAESDLATYRSTFALPPCTTANGCFLKVDENGGTNYPHANTGWAEEISLDIDMVSAVCPNCDILLVEASSSAITDLGNGVDTAVRLGADAVSNSYGANESQKDTSYDTSFYNHPGVSLTVAAGDRGYGVYYPASSPNVTAVGGTTLLPAASSRGWAETAWNGTSSGCSAYEPKPPWQTDAGCAMRSVADVAAVADPSTGVAVYDTFKVGGWLVFGGTSVGAPVIASVYALAGNESSVTDAALAYTSTTGLYDIVAGSTGSCGTYLCNAGPGYDGPTGNGTPDGTKAF